MKISGIICEYNPFHNGHGYLLKKAKESADAVICVMSGNFTQRGEAAIADKVCRAEMAVRCGANLVLELPFPFSSASAAYFATAGIEILGRVGVDTLVFGSESGDIHRLAELATRADDAAETAGKIDPAVGSAKAYYALLGEDERLLPNDILGIEYLRAIRRVNGRMMVKVIKRVGDGYKKINVGDSRYASATALRLRLENGDLASTAYYLPTTVVSSLALGFAAEEVPAGLANAERAVLNFYRTIVPASLSEIAGLGNGLEYRLCDCAAKARSLGEMYRYASTKKYTDSAIRRAVLAGMVGVTWEDLDRGVAYSTVLAADVKGREILSSLRKGTLPLLTKPSDIEALCRKFPEKTDEIRRQAFLSSRADALYTLCLPKIGRRGMYLQKNAVML